MPAFHQYRKHAARYKVQLAVPDRLLSAHRKSNRQNARLKCSGDRVDLFSSSQCAKKEDTMESAALDVAPKYKPAVKAVRSYACV